MYSMTGEPHTQSCQGVGLQWVTKNLKAPGTSLSSSSTTVTAPAIKNCNTVVEVQSCDLDEIYVLLRVLNLSGQTGSLLISNAGSHGRLVGINRLAKSGST